MSAIAELRREGGSDMTGVVFHLHFHNPNGLHGADSERINSFHYLILSP